MISLKVIYYKYIWKCLTYVSDNFTHLPFSKDFLLPRRPPSKNNRNVLKISYIKGKYLVNRYLPLVFCAYSACSKCRIRDQNQERVSQKSGACFPSHSFVSQNKEELLVPTPRVGGLKLPPITTILLFSFVISFNHFIII